jgi:threonine aldolase
LLKSVSIDIEHVQTNIIIFRLNRTPAETDKFKSELKNNGVLISDGSFGSLRAVFHLDVSREETILAIDIFTKLLG